MNSDIQLGPLDLSLEELAEVFNRSFENYFVAVNFDATSLSERMLFEGVDRSCSRIVYRNGRPCGLALISRRGRDCRLAAMGLTAEERGRGVGKRVMEVLLTEARARGDARMFLEVIEQNMPGVALYRGCGFRELERLVGFKQSVDMEVVVTRGLELLRPDEVAKSVGVHQDEDLPWQITAESLATLRGPNLGYVLGSAAACISDPRQPPIVLKGIVVAKGQRREGHGRALLEALLAKHPGSWHIPAVYPERWTPFFEGCGFARGELSQFHMVNEISSSRSASG